MGYFRGKLSWGGNYNKIKKIFECEFHVPVFNLDDEAGMEELVEEITDFFS